jgi:HAD superfamily hydrolase (TIGR01509 family)
MKRDKKFNAVIFDMDGTLIEPLLDFDAIRAEFGVAPQQSILEALNRMPDGDRQRSHARLKEIEVDAAKRSKLLPGAEELIEAIRTAGFKSALLTRNTRDAVGVVLANHPSLRFDVVAAREDGPVKPDAAAVLNICRAFDVPPAKTLCVGDYRYDILAANAAGATSVLLTTQRDRPGFDEWAGEADFRIDRLDELFGILEL